MSGITPTEENDPYAPFSLELEALPVPCVVCVDYRQMKFKANSAMIGLLGEGDDWKASWWMDSLDPLSREVVVPILSGDFSPSGNLTVNLRTRTGDDIEVPMSIGKIQGGTILCFGRPFSEKEKQEQTNGRDKKMCDLTDLLPVGILGVRSCREGTVSLCNRMLESMLDIKKEDSIGHSYLVALSGEALIPVRKLFAKACEEDKSQKLEHIMIVGAGGLRRALEIRVEIVRGACADECGALLVATDVTERIRQQEEKARISEALSYREENYRLLTDNASDLITRHGFEGIILFASNASTSLLGMAPDQMVGHSFEEFVHEDDRPQARDFFLGMSLDNECSTMICRMVAVGGAVPWVETRARAVRGKRGGTEITCVTRDISERKLAEDKLRMLQNYFTDAIENMDAGIVMFDRDDKLIFCNNYYREFYPEITESIIPGVSHKDVLRAFIDNGAAVDSGMSSEEMMQIRAQGHKERKGDHQMMCVGGTRWLQVSDHPTHEGGVVSLLSDVTALKKMQDELTRQKLFLTSLFDAVSDILFYKDASGVYIACNPAFCVSLGKTREEIIGHTDSEIFPKEVLEQVVRSDERMFKEHCTIRDEQEFSTPDGRRVRFDMILTPLFSKEGVFMGIVGVLRDITERHNAENMLKAESLRLMSLVRNIEGAMMLLDNKARVLIVNDGCIKLFKIPDDLSKIIGVDVITLLDRYSTVFLDVKVSTERVRNIFAAGKAVRGGLSALRDDLFVEYDFIPIDMGQGEFNFLWHFRDITSRHVAETELQQRDKLLSGLARSVRQLLGAPEEFDANIAEAFRIIAETADIERIVILRNENMSDDSATWTAKHLYRWSRSSGVTRELSEFANMPFHPNYSRWYSELSQGLILYGVVNEFPESERGLLNKCGFGSVMVVPMFIEGKFWGEMIFDAKRDRRWSSSDRDVLRMVADGIGLSIQRKFAYEELNKALAEAERLAVEARKANQAKSDFLASMSHEIRTPLNGVVGYTNLMRNTRLTQRQTKLLHGIDRSTEMLLALINDILDLSKISAGQITLDALPFCPALAVQDAVAALASRADEKALEIRFESDPASRQVFVGDERRLKQVLLNLIGNAIKFSEKGSVTIRVSSDVDPCEEATSKPIRLNFSVSDTGIGISEENMPKLFRPFSQAHSDIGRRFGGTGLGLAICKQLVELMGGRIGVSSRVGEGSTFSFYIECPLAVGQPDESYEQIQGKPVGGTGSELKLRILIADDNMINQEVLLLYCEDLGYEAEVVSDGEAAVKAVRDHQVDLVLMDLRMPGMDGIEATKAIRAWEKSHLPEGRRPVRIVALTADAIKSDSVRCREIGMDDYLTKPVDPDQIERVIGQLFK